MDPAMALPPGCTHRKGLDQQGVEGLAARRARLERLGQLPQLHTTVCRPTRRRASAHAARLHAHPIRTQFTPTHPPTHPNTHAYVRQARPLACSDACTCSTASTLVALSRSHASRPAPPPLLAGSHANAPSMHRWLASCGRRGSWWACHQAARQTGTTCPLGAHWWGSPGQPFLSHTV